MSSLVLLCIDDRPEILRLRRSALEGRGYSVATAIDASIGIAILEQMSVAAVLLEYRTDGINAEAVAYYIKQRFPRQPIILISAYPELPERMLWLIDEHVMKNEYLERLDEAIRRVTTSSAA